MNLDKPKLSRRLRKELAVQIGRMAADIHEMDVQNDELKKFGCCLSTCAGALLNPFHLEELTNLIIQFSEKKTNEMIAAKN